MAENDTQQHEKTEQPTAKRLEEARRRGEVPRSRELSMTLVMLSGTGCMLAMGPYIRVKLEELVTLGLDLERETVIESASMLTNFGLGIQTALELLAPLFVVLIVAAIAGNLGLGGWAFSAEALTPKFNKINPASGIKRVFGWNGFAELAKALAKFLLVGLVGIFLLWSQAQELLGLSQLTPDAGLVKAGQLIVISAIGLCSALILIAAVDVPFQWWQHRKKLRMTKQEVKEEHKETEGKPELRSKIRQAQQEISSRRMMEAVPKADVVATNPTHFAVALKYDADGMNAPRVVAKGADLVAFNIRKVAKDHGVPLFEHPPLAQALFYTTSIGDEIPPRLYVAVAQLLTYIYQLRAGLGTGRPATQKPDIEVDEDLLSNSRLARRLAQQGVEQ